MYFKTVWHYLAVRGRMTLLVNIGRFNTSSLLHVTHLPTWGFLLWMAEEVAGAWFLFTLFPAVPQSHSIHSENISNAIFKWLFFSFVKRTYFPISSHDLHWPMAKLKDLYLNLGFLIAGCLVVAKVIHEPCVPADALVSNIGCRYMG